MRRLFVLRPEPGASETEARARALGLTPVRRPLFEIAAIDWADPDPGSFDALLITSANAVRVAGNRLTRLRGLPAHAVGKATAEAARAAGLDIASTGDGGVERLLGSIEPDLRLLHLCGADRTGVTGAQQTITALPVYEARAADAPDLAGLPGSVALLHSPRAARRLAELVEERATIDLVAISDAAAASAGQGWRSVVAAAAPDDSAMLALARSLCDTDRQP